jgi:hypothetical protein
LIEAASKTVEAGVDLLIAEHLSHVERAVRDIRRHEVGDEVAAEEERKGNKTEPDYEREAELRRQAREKLEKRSWRCRDRSKRRRQRSRRKKGGRRGA